MTRAVVLLLLLIIAAPSLAWNANGYKAIPAPPPELTNFQNSETSEGGP